MNSCLRLSPILIFTLSLCSCVQHEIRDAFDEVNRSITLSNDSMMHTDQVLVQHMLKDTLTDLKSRKTTTMIEVSESSERLTLYIGHLQARLDSLSDQDADLTSSTTLLADGPEGKVLESKLRSYRAHIDSLMSGYPLEQPLPLDLSPPLTPDAKTRSWQHAYFHMVPKVAAITILNKFKNDVRVTETLCLERLNKAAE